MFFGCFFIATANFAGKTDKDIAKNLSGLVAEALGGVLKLGHYQAFCLKLLVWPLNFHKDQNWRGHESCD